MTDVAVVVPSRNRSASLTRLLDALAVQTVVPTEVAVVLDGSTDDSEAVLAARRGDPFRLVWHAQPRRGAGAARNAGVARTAAPVVVFLDDDVVPEPTCVEHHVRRHDGVRCVVVGDCPIALPSRPRPHELKSWAWWVDFNHRRSAPSSPRTYRDVCAGNLSVRREDFDAVGGFDEGFTGYGAEDWELGVRLLDAGLLVVVEPAAVAWHHRRHTVAGMLANMRSEGRADVHFGRRHPGMRSHLRLRYLPGGDLEARVRRAFAAPARADLALRAAVARLAVMAPTRRWWWRYDDLRAEAYWWGVAEALGSWSAWEAFVAGVPECAAEVDAASLPPRLDVPDGVPVHLTVTWHGEPIGAFRLPASASRERDELARRITASFGGPLLLRIAG